MNDADAFVQALSRGAEHCAHPTRDGGVCGLTEPTHRDGMLSHDFLLPLSAEPWPEEAAADRSAQEAPQQSRRSWRAQDLSELVNGTFKPALPTVGARADGVGVLYPGRMSTVAAESEAGKTWFALVLVLQELNRGNHVVYMDFEDEAAGVVGRLLSMGANIDDVLERFHYIRPEEPLSAVDLVDLAAVLQLGPTLAVVDGVTEGMSLHGLNINDNKDVAVFGRRVLRPLQDAGPAVVTLDHVVKSADNRGRYAIGGVHKLNGLNGVMYLLENVKPFGLGVKGRSIVRIAKDRPGQLRKESLPHKSGLFWFADLVVDATEPGLVEAVLYAPIAQAEDVDPEEQKEAEAQARVDAAKPRVLRAIQTAKRPLSGREILERVPGKQAEVRRAVAALVDEGRLVTKPGPRGATLHDLPGGKSDG
ncbi:AAA family ATPase [Streptomyces sp. NPDC007971]|uniref:AAA family ATPase n=1 Tax=Streptomyces sp. NPDC007971 TaxID=3364799 RepID=UPI0036EBE722